MRMLFNYGVRQRSNIRGGRFHAWQSALLFSVSFIIHIIFSWSSILSWIIFAGNIVLIAFLALRAYRDGTSIYYSSHSMQPPLANPCVHQPRLLTGMKFPSLDRSPVSSQMANEQQSDRVYGAEFDFFGQRIIELWVRSLALGINGWPHNYIILLRYPSIMFQTFIRNAIRCVSYFLNAPGSC